jgi:transaldolase
VSPFVGRLDAISEDGMGLVQDIVHIFSNYNIKTKVLAASIHTMQHILEAARIGADIVTVPPQLISQMLNHPMTDSGLEKFMEDAKNIKF